MIILIYILLLHGMARLLLFYLPTTILWISPEAQILCLILCLEKKKRNKYSHQKSVFS